MAEKLKQMRQKAKEMEGTTLQKFVATKEIAIDSDKKTATFVMSTESIDRHGEMVEQESWNTDHFEKSPRFFWQHESRDFPLGKWISFWMEDDPDKEGKQRLMGTVEFGADIYEKADLAFKMVERGYLNTVSVGFIPHIVDYDEEKDCFVLKECELVECSLVGVPSNREALLQERESKKEDAKTKAIDTKKTLEREIEDAELAVAMKKHKARELLDKAIRQL